MGVFTAWFTAVGLQVFRDVRQARRVPIPREFVASGAVFGMLSLFPEELGGILAWGFLIALALQAGGPQALAGGGTKATNLPVMSGRVPAAAGGGGRTGVKK